MREESPDKAAPPPRERRRRERRWLVAVVTVLVVIRLAMVVVLDNQGRLQGPHEIAISALMYFAYVVGPALIVLVPLAIVGVIVALLVLPRKPDPPDKRD